MRQTDPLNRLKLLVRWRTVFLIAALLLPFALFLLFERQARRLDALADHGEPVEAYVTAVSRDGGTTYYAYRVNGIDYTWNVARREAPFPAGHLFQAVYLPENPALSRPIADRSLAAQESARNRRFSWKAVLGLGSTLVGFAVFVHLDLRRLRKSVSPGISDAQAYQQKLALSFILFLPVFVLIGEFHIRDAVERGEILLPGVIALCIPIAVVSAAFFFAARGGPVKTQERWARILRWAAPAAGGIALLRLVSLLLGN